MRWLLLLLLPGMVFAQTEKDHYRLVDLYESKTMSSSRSTTWKPGNQVPLEISGMTMMPDGRLMTAIRRGECWIPLQDGGHPW